MSDYRDPNDPMYGSYEPAGRTSGGWGWIAGAVFLVIVLALAFGVAREPSRVASNDQPSAATRTTPPAQTTNPAATIPGLAPPPEATPNK